MKTTNQLKMELLAAKYFCRKKSHPMTRIKWWFIGFSAYRELQRRQHSKWIA